MMTKLYDALAGLTSRAWLVDAGHFVLPGGIWKNRQILADAYECRLGTEQYTQCMFILGLLDAWVLIALRGEHRVSRVKIVLGNQKGKIL